MAIWRSLSINGKVNIAREADFNLAVSAEINEDLDSALYWAGRAKQLGDPDAPYYMAELRKRKAVEPFLLL